jgi:acetoacetyl-CoA synthetase
MTSDQNSTNGALTEKLWENSDPKATELFKFIEHINQKYSKNFSTYDDLYNWSINNISDFWGEIWQYTGIVGSEYTKVCLQSSNE